MSGENTPPPFEGGGRGEVTDGEQDNHPLTPSFKRRGDYYFGSYPPDFFDLIIIDECHRGGANDESNWRDIMNYFSPAVQLGLTATPKRKDNVDTYKYFGEPLYTYSLKAGINDGFLTPFKIHRIKTTLDDYMYTSDDEIIEGEIEEGKQYVEKDFNRTIEIEAREAKRVEIYMSDCDQNDKALVFGATQAHAALLRDLINQFAESKDPFYCVRVTANDGERGEQYLRDFQDNEKLIPTILTTSQKLSTGVDARNIRNIVLMRPINSMIEFKQIIGRGTRLYEGKEYFTIYDFVDAYHHFADPEWDGEPIGEVTEDEPRVKKPKDNLPPAPLLENEGEERKKKIKIKLRDGKEREIRHMISTSFWSADGKPMSVQEFMDSMIGIMPNYCKTEEELRILWSAPKTRKDFLDKLAEQGYNKENLETLQKMLDAEACDLLDVLSYVSFLTPKISRTERVDKTKDEIFAGADEKHTEFLNFIIAKYSEKGVEELDDEKLPVLLNLKYHSTADAVRILGNVETIRHSFLNFQKHLYSRAA
jgi:type I restriction enzyme R subunit